MKKSTLFLFIILLFGSCSSTQNYYSTISTEDPYTYKDDKGVFVVDGDSIDVYYSFRGENAPLSITIHNKMSRLIYVDWNNSWLTINDDESINYGDILDPSMSLYIIHPKAYRTQEIMKISNLQTDLIPDKHFRKVEVEDKNKRKVSIKSLSFNEANSPLYINSYLSINIGKLGAEELIFEQSFYVSKILKTSNTSDIQLDETDNNRGDCFYIKSEKPKKEKDENKEGTNWVGLIFETLFEIIFPSDSYE